MNVPREIDELMWEIAERKDEAIEAQFVARYPSFSSELVKRKKMVADLKGSRPLKEPALFVPSQDVRNFGPSRPAVVAASLVLLASFAFATYATMNFFNSRRIDQPVVPPTRIAYESPGPVQEPTPEPPIEQAPTPGAFQSKPQEPLQVEPYLASITVSSERTALSAVIDDIATQAGLAVTIAPGFEDHTIFILYENQPAIGVLNDLGRRYGFTVFTQGKDELLIIPARGSGSINETGASGVATEVRGSKMKDGSPID